jgi:hypothetical protein
MSLKIFSLFLTLFSALPALAQTETFGMLSYTAPVGWQRMADKDHIKFTEIKNQTSYCILTIYNTRESLGTADKDFEKDWTDLAVRPFKAMENPEIQKQQAGEWHIIAGASAYTFQGSDGLLMLTVISGKGKSASILSVTNDTSYITFIQDFLGGIDAKIENIKPAATTKPASTASNAGFAGKWGRAGSSPWGLDPGTIMTNQGNYKCQYEFKKDGTYTFYAERWGGYSKSNEFWITNENGTYKIDGDRVVIKPAKSKMVMKNREGVASKSQQLSIAPRTYRWQFHYFEGIGENNLVLRTEKETAQDGKFAGNEQFPNSYLYSQDYKPEWRFR